MPAQFFRPPPLRRRYLTSDWKSLRREGDVASRELLPSTPLSEASAAAGRVVVVVLSGLRLDALTKHAGLKGWVDGEVAAKRVGSGMNCTLRTTTPSLSLPAWVALLTGVQPEVHGLLGNRGPRSYVLVAALIDVGAQRVGSVGGDAVVVDLVRSKVAPLQVTRRHCHHHHHPPPPPPPPPPPHLLPSLPLQGDGSVSSAYEKFEALTADADAADGRREDAFMAALDGDARLVLAQFSEINTAGHLDGVQFSGDSYDETKPYSLAIDSKVALLQRAVDKIDDRSDVPTTLLVLSDHGHLDRGGAGGTSAAERDVPFLARRAGSWGAPLAGYELCPEETRMVDVAPTVAALLGLPVPRHSQGRLLLNLFVHNTTAVSAAGAGAAAHGAARARRALGARFGAGAAEGGGGGGGHV